MESIWGFFPWLTFFHRFSPTFGQGKESGVKMTETGGAVVCAVAQLFKAASGADLGTCGGPEKSHEKVPTWPTWMYRDGSWKLGRIKRLATGFMTYTYIYMGYSLGWNHPLIQTFY